MLYACYHYACFQGFPFIKQFGFHMFQRSKNIITDVRNNLESLSLMMFLTSRIQTTFI